jgi:hypothetical protein
MLYCAERGSGRKVRVACRYGLVWIGASPVLREDGRVAERGRFYAAERERTFAHSLHARACRAVL